MDAHKKVLLVGDTALMAVTEAALSAYPAMEIKRVAAPCEDHLDYDAIIVERNLPDERVLALACANPGVLIFALNWNEETFSWMLVHKGLTLDAEHLSALICQRPDLS